MSVWSDNKPHSGFLIVSNSRCGSTWLSTSLENIDNAEVDFEAKIDIDNPYPWSAVHFPISSESIENDLARLKAKVLEQGNSGTAAKKGTVWGSKLVLDPYRPTLLCRSTVLEERMFLLDNVIKHGVAVGLRFVHLTRNICDQEISRGGQTPSKRGLTSDTSSELVKSVNTSGNLLYDQKVATHRCGIEARVRMAYDLVIARALARYKAEAFEVEYEDLATRFGDIASFVRAPTQLSIDELQVTEKNRHRLLTDRCCVGQSFTKTSALLRKNVGPELSKALPGNLELIDLEPFIQVAIDEWADLAISQRTWAGGVVFDIRGRLRLRSRFASLLSRHTRRMN
jgi:hypothetical protein